MILDGLIALVDKSFLRQGEGGDGELRFWMLETIREYALERLDARADAVAIRRQHAAYYLALAEAAAPALSGSAQAGWLDRLEQEHDNLRAALTWALEQHAAITALRLVVALWRFWEAHSYATGEGRHWLAAALELAHTHPEVPPELRAGALHGAGELARNQGDYAQAYALLEESLAIQRAIGEPRAIAGTLNYLGATAAEQTDYPRAQGFFTESLALFRALGDAPMIARALGNLGLMAYDQGDPAAAGGLLEESLALFRTLEDKRGLSYVLIQLGMAEISQGHYPRATALLAESQALGSALGEQEVVAWALRNLGALAHCQGDAGRAATLLAESLALFRAQGDKSGIIECLEGLAQVAAARTAGAQAARLFGAAEALRATFGLPRPPGERAAYEQAIAAARTHLAAAAFAGAWEQGRALTLDQAIASALAAPG